MTISAVASTSHAAVERKSSDTANDATGACPDAQRRSESFAGVLAGVMQPKPKLEPKTPKADGTSELDQTDTPDDADPGSVGTSDESKPAIVATTSSANDIVRSLAALDPQLQAKLERVANRVREETGHTVTVEETYRSQSRQDKLYDQGRDTAGPVVTWTKSSKHTQGRAVDVALDGGNADSAAYKALQRIANEEGLRTLGAKDPGHLELRGTGKNANVNATPIPAEPADASGPGGVSIAHVAQVAQVAKVAQARAAKPAQVARVSPVDASGYSAMNASYTPREQTTSSHVSSVHTAAPAAGAEAVARAERIMNAMDNAPARSLSQITMSVDGGNGTTDRIHLAMRGSSLDTTIDTGDARLSQVLSARSDELSRALAKDGIELQEFRVRTAAESTTVTAAGASHNAQSSNDAASHSRFDRGNAWQQQRDQQDQQERQRSQQERGRQQRGQRGGRQ